VSSGTPQRTVRIPEPVIGAERSKGPFRAHSRPVKSVLRAHAELFLLRSRGASRRAKERKAVIQMDRSERLGMFEQVAGRNRT
tara:strand:+ start:752 stop:1000 length:249 start_codon:yes stop_codon:yes gene_type:complete